VQRWRLPTAFSIPRRRLFISGAILSFDNGADP
jgi:hypothetical protein